MKIPDMRLQIAEVAAATLGLALATLTPLVLAQGAAADSLLPAALPQWEVVSVHPNDPGSCTGDAGMSTSKDGIHIFCVPLLFAIEQAYRISESARILNAPDWVKTTRYEIEAKVAGEDAAVFSKLSREARGRMLQPVLADRFRLRAHIEQREMPVYELVVAKGGSKLKAATPDDGARGAHMMMDGHGKIDGANVTLAGLPGILNREVGRPVLDKTGLTGKYTFTVEYVPESAAATDQSGGPSIFTAIEEQLGLKLQPAKAPLDVVVIDSIQQPAMN